MVRRVVCGCGGEGLEEFLRGEALYFKGRSQSCQRSVAGDASIKSHLHGQRKSNVQVSDFDWNILVLLAGTSSDVRMVPTGLRVSPPFRPYTKVRNYGRAS